ncbi:MAG: hypothetical protein WC119_02860 [Synergistaceae bacterium]
MSNSSAEINFQNGLKLSNAKRLVRRFSLWLDDVTRKWVIPSSVWTKIDNGDLSASVDLSEIAIKWGTLDPAFVRASLMLRRIDAQQRQRRQRIYKENY